MRLARVVVEEEEAVYPGFAVRLGAVLVSVGQEVEAAAAPTAVQVPAAVPSPIQVAAEVASAVPAYAAAEAEAAAADADADGDADAVPTLRARSPKTALPDVHKEFAKLGDEGLRIWLRSLAVDTLRAIIRREDMDAARRASRWKDVGRLAEFIADALEVRRNRGAAFIGREPRGVSGSLDGMDV
ncbi:hypothetical protein [Caballeronia sp. GAWG2-1]|uniref:hypothetical protein n=1 Tax=Caballeronia sp. GAWG2-1 TaxID=2921744 RepID=UPI002027C14A|nr:hypothetical protein [Caballeronia sp. GAWG2-1]